MPEVLPLLFGSYALGHLGLLTTELLWTDEDNSLVWYPLLMIAFGGAWDNVRLLLGSAYGKDGASVFMSHVSFFLHTTVLPALLGSYSHIIAALTDVTWLKLCGVIVVIPLCLNGLNEYATKVHGRLVYTEKDGLPRYTLDRHLVRKQFFLDLYTHIRSQYTEHNAGHIGL